VRKKIVVIAAVGALSLAGCSTGSNGDGDRARVMGDAKDRMPSRTAGDWVTYADHVVVASAVTEASVPPSQEDVDRKEGIIGREVTMRVDKVLWSRPDPAKPAPETYVRTSSGWSFHGDVTERTEFALHDRPRIEVGHQYVIALAWAGARCASGDEPEPAHWVGLGEGSTVPFDEGVIGQGEMEGVETTPPAATSRTASSEKLEEQLAGKGADALVSALRSAEPQMRDRAAAPAARGLADTCSGSSPAAS
jgi:hypothetical protein